MSTNNPHVWQLNALWGEHNLTQTFISQGFWEVDPSHKGFIATQNKFDQIRQGDTVQLISYTRGTCRSTEATGLVRRIHLRSMKIFIDWTQVTSRHRQFHSGKVRPINGPYRLTQTSHTKAKHSINN